MSERVDQLTGHPVHQAVRDLAWRLRELGVPDEYFERRTRSVDVLDHTERCVAATDQALVSAAMFDNVQQALSAIIDELTNFESSGDVAHLDASFGVLTDTVLDRVRLLPLGPPEELAAAASEQVKRLSDQVQTASDRWAVKEQELGDQMAGLATDIEALRAALGTQASEFEAKVTALAATAVEHQAAQVATATEQQAAHDANITALETRLTNSISTFETQAETERASHTAAVNAAVADAEARTTTAVSEFTTASSTALESLTTRFETAEAERVAASDAERAAAASSAEEFLAELSRLRDAAAELVGTVASTGTAGHFKQVAESEKKAADLWRWISVGFAIVAVGVAMWAAIHTATTPTVQWQTILAKLLLTVTLGGIAAYASQQSGGHREQERSARHTQLQLSSVDAFLHSVDDEQAAQIRRDLAMHVFGPRPAAQAPAGVPDSPGATQLVTAVAEGVAQGVAKGGK
jgi:hypothetical protein